MGMNPWKFAGSCAALFLALVPLSAGAVSINLAVMINGQVVGNYDETALLCIGNGETPTANCTGQWDDRIELGGPNGIRLDSWSLFVDTDPVVSATTAFTNLSAVTQQVTLLFTLPIAPSIPGGTLIGGSIAGSATDNNGDGVTLSTALGSSLYTAIIDGADVQSLYTDPSSWSAGAFSSANVPSASFGTPIPNQAGPAALASIGIRLDFLLTGNDSASITSNFVVLPVPVPAAAWLFSSGLCLLGWMRHRTPAENK